MTNSLQSFISNACPRIMSFYFMIDLLRAITLNTATSFQASDMQIPSSNGVPLDKVYEHLVLDSEPLTQDLSPDDYLLILLMIIAETLQLQRRLGPLIDWDSICHAEKAPTDLGRKGEEYDTTGSTFVYSNPYVPNSASGEYLRISHLLSAALTLWTSACMEMVSGKLSPRKGESRAAPRVDPSTLLLVYFCRLLLAGGSHILSLIPMVGFCARGNFKVPQHLDPADIPVINDDALRLAWLILDNIEPKLPDDSPKWYALWCPIVCFTAALTVWASLQTKWSAKGTDHMGLAGSKTLRLFEFELRDMPWPCSAVMADILAELRVR
ncbi:hypothetical protein BJ170DRAFT_224462 [Xylariales sp. AK1849]|nr:hypothetical protein BJ170DRAFT_224462 [Xylariales sp. AK1849]